MQLTLQMPSQSRLLSGLRNSLESKQQYHSRQTLISIEAEVLCRDMTEMRAAGIDSPVRRDNGSDLPEDKVTMMALTGA